MNNAIKTVSERQHLSVEESMQLTIGAIDSGKAIETLNKLVEYSNK